MQVGAVQVSLGARDPARYLSSGFVDEPMTSLGTTLKPRETSVQVGVHVLRVNMARAIERSRGKELKIDDLFLLFIVLLLLCVCLSVPTASELCTLRKCEGNPANFKSFLQRQQEEENWYILIILGK